ncbi:hypothetical protein P7K49_012001 [Saguinus oedipus]|uniref:Uncharacterized protein n=1 Tax=Saguinus oedipus TaxID=9490 RepID=A0ABQ9VTT2_SAGOE|nr:hypothetical protein P7K49_012001 [Saguinus oedipus]
MGKGQERPQLVHPLATPPRMSPAPPALPTVHADCPRAWARGAPHVPSLWMISPISQQLSPWNADIQPTAPQGLSGSATRQQTGVGNPWAGREAAGPLRRAHMCRAAFPMGPRCRPDQHGSLTED